MNEWIDVKTSLLFNTAKSTTHTLIYTTINLYGLNQTEIALQGKNHSLPMFKEIYHIDHFYDAFMMLLCLFSETPKLQFPLNIIA